MSGMKRDAEKKIILCFHAFSSETLLSISKKVGYQFDLDVYTYVRVWIIFEYDNLFKLPSTCAVVYTCI